MKCFLCQKHAGEIASPPGGYIYDDLHWMVCHAPVDKGPLGTLFINLNAISWILLNCYRMKPQAMAFC